MSVSLFGEGGCTLAGLLAANNVFESFGEGYSRSTRLLRAAFSALCKGVNGYRLYLCLYCVKGGGEPWSGSGYLGKLVASSAVPNSV